MMASVKDFLKVAIEAYPSMERTDWVLKWPGQVVIAGCQTYWAQEVEEAITQAKMVEYCERVCQMLADLVALVRGKLSNLERMILSALIVIEVHARDVTLGLRDDKVDQSTSSNGSHSSATTGPVEHSSERSMPSLSMVTSIWVTRVGWLLHR